MAGKNKPPGFNEQYICRFIKDPPAAMYDIGVGPPSKAEWRWLKQRYPDMILWGTEPNEQVRAKLNDFPGDLSPYAIAPAGIAQLHLPPPDQNPGSASLFPLPNTHDITSVPTISLDDFDEMARHPERILLWLDVEGSELNVLDSGPLLLNSKRVRWINLEVRSRQEADTAWLGGGCSHEEVHERLAGHLFAGHVGVDDVGGFDAMQDHVHRADDIGQRFLFLGVEGRLLELATIGH